MEIPPGSLEPTPPHAPARRQLAEDPLQVVDRLLADQASELDSDERWQTYGEIDDHLATQRARTSLRQRLAASVNTTVTVKVGDCPEFGIELTRVGKGWCQALRDGRQLLLNPESVDVWTNLALAGNGREPEEASTAALLRAHAAGRQALTIRTAREQRLHGRLIAALQDHLDLHTERGRITVRYDKIAWID